MLFNHVARVADEHARLYELDGVLKTFSGSFNDTDGVCGSVGCTANVICLVEVAVKAAMIESHVKVEDVTGLEKSLIRNTVADNFVDGCAEGFGKVDVIEGRGIGL